MTKRVGVLFVHGMGERKRLQHLNECVDDIVAAMRENLGVNVDDRPAMGEAPRRLVVGDTVIECHEVYWADLNEDDTTADQVRFWFWALSMWNARRVIDRSKFIPGAGKMRIPKGVLSPVAHAIARFRLYGVCFIFVPILFVLTVVKFPLKRTRLGNWLGPDTVYTLLRDVKLYEQERWRIPHSPKIRLEEPRVEIRRRMIQKLVEMGLQGYDSCYVFAHSLGSIVAWNGLMETEHSLPNYLDAKIWSQCTQPIPSGPNRGRSLAVTRGNAGPTALMMPARPKFLTNANAIIDRTRLFNGRVDRSVWSEKGSLFGRKVTAVAYVHGELVATTEHLVRDLQEF